MTSAQVDPGKAPEEGYERGLNSRQVQMIAIVALFGGLVRVDLRRGHVWCAFLHADPDLLSASDRVSIPPDDGAERASHPARCLAGGLPARWRTRPNIRVVFAGRS